MSGISRSPAGTKEKVAQRRLHAYELRIQGESYRAIGQALGVSEYTAHGDVMGRLREVQALGDEKLEDVRRVEVARLDRYLTKLELGVNEGDPKAIATALRVMERRAALLGLDAPKVSEQPTDVSQLLTALQAHGNGNGTGRIEYDA